MRCRRRSETWEDVGRCGDVKDQGSLKSLASRYEKDPAALLGRSLPCKIHPDYHDSSKYCFVVLILAIVALQERRDIRMQQAVCYVTNLSRAPTHYGYKLLYTYTIYRL